MLASYIINTIDQKVLSLLAKFSGEEFYEREVARTPNIAYGSANRSLNQLYLTGAIKRRHEGRMYFYSIDISVPAVIEYKKLVNLMLLEPLVENLKKVTNRIVLYGSCARGTDNYQSDLDLFIVTSNEEKTTEIIGGFSFPRGFENLHIQPVIKTTIELLQAGESEKAFLEEVEQGLVLWEEAAHESRL